MHYLVSRIFLSAVGLLLTAATARAQTPAAPFRACGTPPLTPGQWQRMLDELPAVHRLSTQNAARRAPVSLTYVPLKLHVVRDSAGQGGTPPADIYRALVGVNERFAAAGVQFYACGQIDFVDDSTYLAFDGFEEYALADPRDVAGTFNIYFVQSIRTRSGIAACGYAYYPGTSGRRVLMACINIRTLTHELGHAFDLIHTQGDSNSPDELADGSNCATAGDLVCDTPADPYGQSGATATGCTYTGTTLDANGARYAPYLDNVMGYWSSCQGRMRPSAGQMARAQAAYQLHHAAQMACADSDPTPPANLTIAAAPGRAARLTWTDLATTELGYFVERAASATASFATIGYTLPGGTAFTDPAPPAGALTYRVKPINAAGAFSNEATYAAPPGAYCIPVNANPNCAPNPTRYLDGVRLTQGATTVINNMANGCGDFTYFAADSGALTVGAAATMRLEWPSGTSLYAGAWLDLNHDGDFADANEQLFSTTSTGTPRIVSFTVPANTPPGPVRLRVRVQTTLEGPVTDPCANASSGETEDYPLRLRTITGRADEEASAIAWHLTPNPVRATDVWVELTGPTNHAPLTARVLDAVGRVVLTTPLPGAGPYRVDVRGLRPGSYLVRVGAVTRRLVVVN